MSVAKLEIDKWGPEKLQEIHKQIADAVNLRTPIAGCGITATEEPDGVQLSLENNPAPTGPSGGGGSAGGGSSGTNVDVYGAKDGAPYVFHLLQTSAPTPVPP